MRARGGLAIGALGALIGVAIVALMFLLPAYARYQKRANAENSVKVSTIEIRNQEQRVIIEKQKAEIKHQNAIGQRLANQEIAARLTPLFVQYEMIEALKAIAASGSNNSVVYIPSGANGVPLVSLSNKPQVYEGDTKP